MGELGIVEGWALIGCDEWDIHASPKGFAGHGGIYVLGGAKRGEGMEKKVKRVNGKGEKRGR